MTSESQKQRWILHEEYISQDDAIYIWLVFLKKDFCSFVGSLGIFSESRKSFKDSFYKNAHDIIYTEFLSKMSGFYDFLEPVHGPQAKNVWTF